METDLTNQINDLADRIKDLQDEKADALRKVEESIPEYDSAWLQDPNKVWDVLVGEYMRGKDLNFEQVAEIMNQFEDMWFSIPTAQRTPEGIREWAEIHMAENNFYLVMEAIYKEPISQDDFIEIRTAFHQQFPDRYATADVFAQQDMEEILEIISQPNLTQEGIGWLNQWISDNLGTGDAVDLTSLDLLTMQDYDMLLELGDLRHDFHYEGGYEEFRDEQLARIAGRGFSGAVDGSQMTKADMAKVTSPGGQVAYVHPGAAPSLQEMFEAAAAEGVSLRVDDSYRSWAFQYQTWRNFNDPNHENYRKNSNGQPVDNIAHPDSSNHPKGLAVDFGGPGAIDWLERRGSEFGWYRIPNEEWHWEYRGPLGLVDDTPTPGERTLGRPGTQRPL